MALIEVFHVVADNVPVDPEFTTDIERGLCVSLTSAGLAAPGTNTGLPYGLAGDTQSNTEAGTAYAADLVIGSNGAYTRSTQNRVANMFNETLASGLMTVYHSGGVFKTDQYEDLTYTVGGLVYSSATGTLTTSNNGGAALAVGQVLATPEMYPSGVPGTDVEGSISLGTFITIKLLA